MEDSIAQLLRSFRSILVIGADHPDILENLLIAVVTGLDDQSAHRIDDDRSSTAIYAARERLDGEFLVSSFYLRLLLYLQ